MRIKQLIAESYQTDIVNMFGKFLPLAMEILELDSLPKFVFDRELDTGSQPSFGMYDADNRVLHVALANRHPVDILRTVAHELVHYKQDLLDQLQDDSGQTGSPEENQANELAGVILRNFNKRYPEFLKIKPIISESSLQESKSAPLYHFTTWNNLISILHSNQLNPKDGKIYLTRDYTRQFIPHKQDLLTQPYGLRLNQELLSRNYGRKLQPGGQDIGWDEKKRQAWLADPKNAREIEIVKQTGQGSGSRYDGANPEDIVRGTVVQSRRWESEEHLNVKNLPNLDKYITGIIIGKAPIGSVHRTKELDPDPLTKLADILIHLFSGPKGFDQRNWFLDTTAKLSVPIIYDRKEYDSAKVKKRIIQLYSQRKKEREEEQSKPQKDFMVITSPAGGGIVTGGSDINVVFNKLVKDPRHTNREIYGYSIGLGPNSEKKMFDRPIPLLQLVKQDVSESIAPPLPRVLYHGGPKPITKFNTPPQGVYFSPHLNHARGYGDVVTAARVNANNVYLIDYENDIDEEIMDALFDMDYKRVAKYIKLLQKQGYDAMQSISDSEMVVVFPGTPIQVIDDQQGVAETSLFDPVPGKINQGDLVSIRGSSETWKVIAVNLQRTRAKIKSQDTGMIHMWDADKLTKIVDENFADGKNPQDRGDSARHGIRKGMTIAQLKKIRSSDSASPRKKQLAHWQINMRQGKKE